MTETRGGLSVEDVFTRLAQRLPNYEHRSQQLELAQQIQRAFDLGKTGLFEAGTGTGKSLAALIPALLSNKKVVVSTNTISLQEQYINKDIPALRDVVPFEFEATLMKGRGNYLGLRRWHEHLLEQELDEKLIDWVQTTTFGDISELQFVPGFETWMEINSDSDDCLRNKCPHFNNCFYFEARKRAEKADILVVNHALLLADACSHGNIIPKYDLLIIDEAHHLPDVATDAFSTALSNRGIRALGNRAIKKVGAPPGLIHDIEVEAGDFFHRLAMSCRAMKTRIREPLDGADDLALVLRQLMHWLQEQEFEHILDVGMARDRAKAKAKALISTVNNYLACLDLLIRPDPNWVVWVERGDISGSKLEIVAAPLDVAPSIKSLLLDKTDLHSSVWMSATLATSGDDPFSYFKKTVGVDGRVVQSKVSSPFDYARQSMLYLPRNMPEPNQPTFLGAAAREIEHLLELSEGRAFVLFTSRAALNNTFDMLAPTLAYPCRKQGEMPRAKLIEWFLNTPSAVLFGTSSFWEGVSIDGDRLSCVIIDRIPFQVPDDPVYEARCESMKDNPEASWFNDLALPHATMRLKQGVGRLIRTHTDTGIVAILDARITAKRYGRQILEALPPMTIIRSISGVTSIEEKLNQLSSDGADFESSSFGTSSLESSSGNSLRTRHNDMGQWSTK